MQTPESMPRSADATPARSRKMLREAGAGEHRPEAILGRRDVAIVPWVAIGVCALAVALGTWLRGVTGEGATVDAVVFWGALAAATGAGAMASVQDTAIGLRYRGSLAFYLGGALLLLAGLAAAAVRDAGLDTVVFSAGNVMLAAYLGLVLPPRWSRRAIITVVLASGGVHAANPAAEGLDAVITVGLIMAGWAVGALGHVAHARAGRVARALSSYDRLTSMLNRRGLLEQVDAVLAESGTRDGPLALLIIDLDDFKQVNDTRGHAAGDDLLAWVGQTLPTVLPGTAQVGRLGGDEFAVLLRGVPAQEALQLARAARSALGERATASIGVATSETRAIAASDLFQVADAALHRCKIDRSLGVQALVAGTVGRSIPGGAAKKTKRAGDPPPLSYGELRATGRPPRTPEASVVYGWMVSAGLLLIASAGAVVVVDAMLGGRPGLPFDVLRILGLPWVAWNLILARLIWHRDVVEPGGTFNVVFYGSAVSLSFGVGIAMWAHGGLVAPIGAALFLRVLFDAAILPPQTSRWSPIIMLGGWAIALALGPASALWVAPFQLATFGAAWALGSIGYRAFDEVTRHSLSLARTDALTLVPNRLGFDEQAGSALEHAQTSGSPFALIALDLDDFKDVNDAHGHAAGDELLRQVADVLAHTFDDHLAVGRVGGDEFVLVVPAEGAAEAAERTRVLEVALQEVAGASLGFAVHPADGTQLEHLRAAADRRSYDAKRAHDAHAVVSRARPAA